MCPLSISMEYSRIFIIKGFWTIVFIFIYIIFPHIYRYINGKSIGFYTKKVLNFGQKSVQKAVIFVSVFLHLLTNQNLPASYKISLGLGMKIWRIKTKIN